MPNFDSPLTLTFLLHDIAPILLIALPMTLIIVTGEIDLSVASVLGLSSVLLGVLHQGGMSVPAAALVALLVGRWSAARSTDSSSPTSGCPRWPSPSARWRSTAAWPSGCSAPRPSPSSPSGWTDLARPRRWAPAIPMVMIPFLVLAVVFAVLLHFSTFGRGRVRIGLNSEAAHFTGVNVARTKLVLFVLSGVVSAFAGVYYTLRFGSARGDNATGLELQVIAAVLLGGVSIFGGRGGLHGVIAGVVLIGVISSALRLEDVTVNVTNIIIGLLLVVSVISGSVLAWFSDLAARRTTPAAPGTPSGHHQHSAPAGVETPRKR